MWDSWSNFAEEDLQEPESRKWTFNGKKILTNSEIFKFGEALGYRTFLGVMLNQKLREGGGLGAYAHVRRHFAQGEGRSLGEWRIGVFL